jgi:hypothetical protein
MIIEKMAIGRCFRRSVRAGARLSEGADMG